MLAKWLKKKILWDKENTSLGQIILTICYLCPTGSGLSSLAWNSSHLWTDFSSSPSTSQSCFHGLPTTRAYLQSPRLCSFLSLHLCITGICNPYPPFSRLGENLREVPCEWQSIVGREAEWKTEYITKKKQKGGSVQQPLALNACPTNVPELESQPSWAPWQISYPPHKVTFWLKLASVVPITCN